jgi:hypothetical protein
MRAWRSLLATGGLALNFLAARANPLTAQGTPPRMKAFTDTVSMFRVSSAIGLNTMRLPPDSVDRHVSHVRPVIIAGVVGGVAGAILGGLTAPGATCSACYQDASVINRHIVGGAVVGTALGAAIGWWIAERRAH